MITALVADDETTARNRIKSLLKEYRDSIEVIGEATDGREAIEKINELKPDVVFLDIQMPEVDGLQIIGLLEHKPHIVFVTAFHDHAIKAFEQNSLDYLLKPVEAERMKITIDRLRNISTKADTQMQLIQEMVKQLQSPPRLETIPVKKGNKILLIAVADIIFFEAKDKYVYINTFESQYLIDNTLNSLAEKLPSNFIRIHRTFVINKDKIKEVHKHLKGSFIFVMLNKSQTPVTSGNTYYDTLKKILYL